jgi:hypothetical protein
MPWPAFGSGTAPVASVPMKLPATRTEAASCSPPACARWTMRPRTSEPALPAAKRSSACALPAPVPSRATRSTALLPPLASVFSADPPCV